MKTMKKIFLLTLTAAAFASTTVNAQHLKAESQEYVNRFSLAPAFAGYNGNSEAFLGYRTYMTGIEGATKLLTADVNGSIGESMGYGVNIINEKSGNFNNLFAGLTYAYQIRLGEDMGLGFAVTPAFIRSAYNLAGVKTIQGSNTDPVLANEAGLSGTGFDAGFSLMFNFKGLYFSAYAPRLICQDLKFQNGILNSEREIFGSLSYAIETEKWEIEPAASVCYVVGGSEPAWKGSLTVKYNKRAWLTGYYNSEKWIGVGAGFAATGRIAVNYAYEYGMSDIAETCNGTHEITVGFLVSKGHGRGKPSVFFDETSDKKDNRMQDDIRNLRNDIQQLEEEIEAAKKNGVLKNDDNENANPEPEKVAEQTEDKEEKDDNLNMKEWDAPVDMVNVTFASGTSKLNKSSFPGIDTYVSMMSVPDEDTPTLVTKKYSGKKVLILVYTDHGDSKKLNQKLAKERAEAVKAYMVSKGVPANRIQTRGIGKKGGKTSGAEQKFGNNKVQICRSLR